MPKYNSDLRGDEGVDFDPPTPEEVAFDDVVENVIYLFQQVSRSQETASALSEAMYSLDLQMSRRGMYRPSRAQRDRLLVAAVEAYAAAMRRLPDECPRVSIVTGVSVLLGLICYRAADDANRAARSPDFLPNMKAFARMFRNELHNLCLAEEMSTRARGQVHPRWVSQDARTHVSNSKH
ncbi:hypothetical protein [Microvirga sp. VF16]|uniref:hypothetical protein n=1 Tax=Microvirga sp. VF16 TaxID=2807101 RepID=UPI00193D76D6|nr:hypothetical protein [Microvirga sp. VF16]QRM35766.1 hypothetical protein JO965_44030 [Microvirga sp. VF16]